MPWDWVADFETAEWDGPDLIFEAATAIGRVRYIIDGRRLTNTIQRTSAEVLSLNLPTLEHELIARVAHANNGETIKID